MENKCYFLGMGDYIDVASPSNRKLIGQIRSGLYDSVRRMMDERVTDYVNALYEILEPSKGRWLGLLTGHHTWEFEDGTTTESILASRLQSAMLGDCAVVALKLGKRGEMSSNRPGPVAYIWAHHGVGGGMTAGAALNKVAGSVVPYFFANVYLMAHQHRKAATAIPWIEYRFGPGGKVRTIATTRYIVATGSFLKAYEAGSRGAKGYPEGSYVEKRMLGPVSLGAPVISIRPVYQNGTGTRIDVNVSV